MDIFDPGLTLSRQIDFYIYSFWCAVRHPTNSDMSVSPAIVSRRILRSPT
ncbi:MAG: hypothetical protein F6J93_35110 [Oscillatoria sp. SIO1A7]|nr:hypothetical protein [Oscillatoria sp. SIO1A7]